MAGQHAIIARVEDVKVFFQCKCGERLNRPRDSSPEKPPEMFYCPKCQRVLSSEETNANLTLLETLDAFKDWEKIGGGYTVLFEVLEDQK